MRDARTSCDPISIVRQVPNGKPSWLMSSRVTDWTISRDVSDYATIFGSRQPAYFIIGNQTDSTYTGDFFGTLQLTFYGTDAQTPAIAAPDAVIGLNSAVDRGLPTRSGGQPVSSHNRLLTTMGAVAVAALFAAARLAKLRPRTTPADEA